MFNPNDLYTTLGSNKLQACWTNLVTKFDTSSFYNWEQDNLPIYDLDERTSFLWERLGNPTSSINGVALVVSADANPATCNTNIFKTLSGCINAVPEVINYPIVIEVANFGNLGSLHLSNKIFGPRGSIEIINRNYSRVNSTINYLAGDIPVSFEAADSGRTDYLASSVSSNIYVGLFPLDSIQKGFISASALGAGSAAIFSSTTDSRLANNLTLFTRKPLISNNQRLTAALAAKNSATAWAGTSQAVSFNAYEKNAESWDSLTTYDASTLNEISNSIINWGDNAFAQTIPVAYGNRLQSIKIYNCNGPIYIRGFTVDGAGYGGTEYGIDIRNSTVNLDDCSVARCTKAGLHAVNSKVQLIRSFIAYRNYAFNSAGIRNDAPWLTKVNGGSNVVNRDNNKAAGILALNSEIKLNSDQQRFNTLLTQDYVKLTGFTGVSGFNAFDSLVCLSRNDIGIQLINSNLIGGQREQYLGYGDAYFGAQQAFIELNTEAGVKLSNSKFDYSGRLFLLGNFRGLDSFESEVSIDILTALNNQKEAIKLENSKVNYNKELYLPDDTGDPAHIVLKSNGTHLKLTNSVFEPLETSSYVSYYRGVIASGSFGTTQLLSNQRGILPSIIVDSNSKLRLIGANITNPSSFCDDEKPLFGAAFHVNDNSQLILQGTSSYATKIIGPDGFVYQNNKAGLYANNNSTVKIQGPTVIAKYGVDVLCDNSSKLEITPPKKVDGTIDVQGFNLSGPRSHTSVELHSTRACLVANNNSVITMKDAGSYLPYWSSGTYGSSILLSGMDYLVGTDYLNYAPFTSGGFVQFYPNPNDSAAYGTGNPGIQNPTIPGDNNFTRSAWNYNYFLNQYIGDKNNNHEFSSTTVGGMCVRALNGSKVNVDNVHFPCGWPNPSGVVYEYSGPEGVCSRLFIWNIADISQLNAKYITVSGMHPADAAYFGPSGTWSNLSGAPATTPDTGSVSILDLYGRATNHLYGNSTATNQGPFRLYFSIDPAINWARSNQTAGLDGLIPQVYSQGYQFSGNMYFSGNLSSTYKSIIQTSSTAILASGFYYASSVVASPNTVRVMLDDSAANTFANAKHNSTGKSGLAKVVNFYYTFTDMPGSDSSKDSTKSRGKGVKSVNTFDLEKSN